MIKSFASVVATSILFIACGTQDEAPSSDVNARSSSGQLSEGECLGHYSQWTRANNLPFFPTVQNEALQLARFASAQPRCSKAAFNPLFLAVAR